MNTRRVSGSIRNPSRRIGKLSNKNFVDKAPAEVVQQQRDKLAELRSQLTSVAAALAKLAR